MQTRIKLGDIVRDMVTGYEGMAVSEHSYLNKCVRISIQGVVDKDGKIPDSQTFDIEQVAVVKSNVYEGIDVQPTGGPQNAPKPKYEPKR